MMHKPRCDWYDELMSEEARAWSVFLPSEESRLTHEEMDERAKITLNLYPDDMEELVPELNVCFDPNGGFSGNGGIYHPLLHDVAYLDDFNPIYNARFECRKNLMLEALDAALLSDQADEWLGVLYLIDNPYKLNLLEVFAPKIPSSAYWEVLADVWTEVENHWQSLDTIKRLWHMTGHEKNGHYETMFNSDELQVWKNLPNESMTVYRGYTHPEARRGWSWTFSPAKARWFAERVARQDNTPKVVRAEVARKDILAFFDRRNEREVVIDPRNVSRLKSMPLDQPMDSDAW
jgi:hypothetical protein